MTWGFSRDDVEASFFARYLSWLFGSHRSSPSTPTGVGRLVRIAVERGRAARPDLHLGVCGEHGGDPPRSTSSTRRGLDYVSCSPFRVPVARLEAAGRAGRHVRLGQRVNHDPRQMRGAAPLSR